MSQEKLKKNGRPTDYNEELHCHLIVEEFRKLGGVPSFCSVSGICIDTFYNWYDKHPIFRTAYKQAIQVGRALWEQYAIDHPDMNMVLWNSLLRSRYGAMNSRIRKPKDKAAVSRVDSVWTSLEEGEINIKDAKTLTEMALTQVQVEDRAPIAESTILPRDELMRQIETVKAVLDAQKGEGEK